MLWKCWIELLKINQVNKSHTNLMLEQVIGWSVELMSFDFCRVSSLSQHLLNLQMEMRISSVLSSLLMAWNNLSISWDTNWRISAKRSSRRSQTEVKSWRFPNQFIIISYHGEHHIRHVLGMDAGLVVDRYCFLTADADILESRVADGRYNFIYFNKYLRNLKSFENG